MPGLLSAWARSRSMWRVLPLLLLCLSACARYQTTPVDEFPFSEISQSKQSENLRVRLAVLTDQQAEQLFGIDLGSRWIQAVWVEVDNRSERLHWLLSGAADSNVYAPDEIAYSARFFMSPRANEQMVARFRALSFRNPVAPGGSRSGFLFVPRDEDGKEIKISLLTEHHSVNFDFFVPLSGLKAHSVYSTIEEFPAYTRAEVESPAMRELLSGLPCCTSNKSGDKSGDPINLVVVGNPEDLFPAFVRMGWHPAEDTYAGSVWKTMGSFFFGRRYRYSPISPMYLFGRQQDVGLQKARGTIHQRNHLRLWLAPWRWQGRDVWVGTISRDIGVRFTLKTPFLVTHKIDPDVDEARNAFMEAMVLSGRLEQVGYVGGAGLATPEEPGANLTGDPFFHDGLRSVLVLDDRPIPIEEMDFLGWAESEEASRHLHSLD